jgi:hypothetical protein
MNANHDTNSIRKSYEKLIRRQAMQNLPTYKEANYIDPEIIDEIHHHVKLCAPNDVDQYRSEMSDYANYNYYKPNQTPS